MTVFVSLAALLLLAAIARLLLPLLRAPKTAAAASLAEDRRAANLAVFRDQLGELEREHAEGLLSAPDFEQAKSELHRRLLDEVHTEEAGEAAKLATPASRKTALAILLIVPLAAAGLYVWLGNPGGLDPRQTQAQSSVGPQQIEEMVGKLAAKLQQHPDNPKGWVMLARSYKVLGRFAEAAEAYGHASALVEQDPSLLADYAEVLGQMNQGSLQGQASELIAHALALNPDEPQALFLAGAAASERSDFAATVEHWSRLLQQLEAGSEEARSLEAAISNARKIATGSGAPSKEAAAASPGISGEVTLSPKLAAQAKPDDVLFVFARAEDGQRMPLAVVRSTAGALPLRFTLDDSKGLPNGRKISEFKAVRIEARIAKAGMAQTSSGDLFGNLSGVKLGSQSVRLTIDQVQP
jgi:cytochrome c-type biogenesis protein CcmH